LRHGCWLPDEPTRALRRRLARRAQLVRQRTRAKNEIHAVLMRKLKGRPPMSDVFGRGGRVWLAELELPADERETLDGCLRQIDYLDSEIALIERGIAEHALGSQAIRRLMTVPGVSLMTATTFLAAVGDIRRFPDPRKLVSYLGLDPKVRQSGAGAAHHGRISKQGAAQVRQMLTEAAIVAVSTAGPMRALYQRVRVRRGGQIAIVAVARKLAVLFWHLITRGQDYAFQRPSLTRKKLRGLDLRPAPNASPDAATWRPGTPTASAPNAPASASSQSKPRSPTDASSPTGRPPDRTRPSR
jgi:transposase